MVDRAFINSHSYKLILSRDISVLKLLWEQRAASLNWNEAFTYLLASSMMLIQHGSSGQLYATFSSASPSNWWPSTPPDMGGSRNRSHIKQTGSVLHGTVACVRKNMWRAKAATPSDIQRRAHCLTQCLVWFGLQALHSVQAVGGIAVALTSTFNIPIKG